MASAPPKKNTAFSFEVSLPSQAGAVFQVDPTLASGDVQVSIDGGSFTNIDSLPTAISSGAALTVALTSSEMNGDRIVVQFHDQAGDEWCDVQCVIFTVTQQIDDLASQASVNDLPTNAEFASGLSGLNDVSTSDVQAAAAAALTAYDPPTNAELVSEINAVQNDIAALSIPTAVENADALLNRDMSTGTDSGSTTVRTPRQALRFLRNKFEIATGTLTVYKEDDSTSSWTASVTQTAGDPISASDPAGP